MNDFANSYKSNCDKGSKIIRDCCDNPIEVYVHMGFKEVIFKLGYVSTKNIGYSETASDGCYGFGNLCKYRFEIDGRRYDFSNYTDEQALEEWCKIIDDHNTQDCVLSDEDDFVV